MDSIRSRFFWRGAHNKFKYHMAKWETLCRPKDQGGLGVINTMIMNECLLVKWIWKISKGSNELWFRLLKAKYMNDGDFFRSRHNRTSQFWKGLHKVKHLFKWGAQYKVMDGRLTSFWDNSWVSDVPLRLLHPTLYTCCSDQNAMVYEYFNKDSWDIDLNRSFTVLEMELWHSLRDDLSQASLDSSARDEVSWTRENRNFHN